MNPLSSDSANTVDNLINGFDRALKTPLVGDPRQEKTLPSRLMRPN